MSPQACCCHPPAIPATPPAVPPVVRQLSLPKALERVCAIALCAFAAYMSWTLFLGSIAVGVAYQGVKIVLKVNQKGLGDQRPGCGQGFGELISQLRLLPPEVVLATSYVAWRHLVHDPRGFAPFVGFFVGMGLAHHTYNYVQKGEKA
jgi:hypothetical protein